MHTRLKRFSLSISLILIVSSSPFAQISARASYSQLFGKTYFFETPQDNALNEHNKINTVSGFPALEIKFPQAFSITGFYGFRRIHQEYQDGTMYFSSGGDIYKNNFAFTIIQPEYGFSAKKYFNIKKNNAFFMSLNFNISDKRKNLENQFIISQNDTLFGIIHKKSFLKTKRAACEIGWEIWNEKKYSFGLKAGYSQSFSKTFRCEYLVAGKTTEIFSPGSNFYFGAEIALPIYTFSKIKKRNKTGYDFSGKPIKYKNRQISEPLEIEVSTPQLEITVRDYGNSDGDKISLYLNEKLILKKYIITSEHKTLTVQLVPGNNYLVVYAHNLGDEPPNTVRVGYLVGNEEKTLRIQSNLGNCGCINFKYKP